MLAVKRRTAPRIVATILGFAVLTGTADGVAKPRRLGIADLTGFAELTRIAPPPLAQEPPPASPPPARFFVISQVLAQLDRPHPGDLRMASGADTEALVDAALPIPLPARDEPFGLMTFRAPQGPLWEKWRGVSIEISRDLDAMASCRAASDACTPAATRFMALIEEARKRDGRARLEQVNRVVNESIRYTSDLVQHGVADIWLSPLATFASLAGDCKDYAIAKYLALREAGVPAEDLRIILARDNLVHQDHAILATRQDGQWLILDNRRPDLVADRDEEQLTPLFALDQQGVELLAAPYERRTDADKPRALAPAADATTG
jgi:predicted transglutaminase-like cysteine proteinase